MMTKKYSEKPTSQWNVKDFTDYLCDRHLAIYGTEYVPPGRNWQAERGLIGTLIGTKGRNAKPRKFEPEVVKDFIDACFHQHRCSPQWPTVSFTFLWSYKTNIWARVVADSQRKKTQADREAWAKSAEAQRDTEDLSNWL
jgi:hypothetical protein